jgi:recombination protein RecT
VTVPQDVAVREEDVRSLVRSQIWDRRREFANLLPAEVDAETFAGLAAAAMWKDPKLAVAAMTSPESLIIALRDCARLGHQPGTDAYYLTVRGGTVLGIEGFTGVITRMYNAGVKAVHVDVVAKGERLIRREPLPPEHIVPNDDWFSRDLSEPNLIGAYAWAILEDGVPSHPVVMGRAEMMNHRAAAATDKIWSGQWALSMWRKTVIHELEKFVPTSSEYRKERARADAELAKLPVEHTAQVVVEDEAVNFPAAS